MKKPLAATLLAALVLSAAPAQAAHVDRRACVTKAEYNSVHRPMTAAQMRTLLDGWGTLVGYEDNGYWEGEWVNDGYWDSTWVDAGYYDEYGYYVSDGWWEDSWVDDSYYNEYDHYVPMTDAYRTFRKCSGWQRGRGRVVLNLDNYSSTRSGMRVYAKANTRTWRGYGRTTEHPLPDKVTPTQTRAPRPAPVPLTTAPHAGEEAKARARAGEAPLVLK